MTGIPMGLSPAEGKARATIMLGLLVLRSALATFSAAFGGLGVFFIYHSFWTPSLSAYALMFLGTATAIQLTTRR